MSQIYCNASSNMLHPLTRMQLVFGFPILSNAMKIFHGTPFVLAFDQNERIQ
jgi:hypothetical protein